jgi:hypothetical protein
METQQPEFTLAEAGALIGRSPKTLRRQIAKGRLKGRLVGKTYVVARTELMRYVAESRRPDPEVE